jgi:23S rRNA pseudouridine1911/1915/1917 synthase
LAHIGCPVLCDKLYGGRTLIKRSELVRGRADDDTIVLARQALHALRIKLAHPASGEPIEFIAPLPGDLTAVLVELREAARP